MKLIKCIDVSEMIPGEIYAIDFYDCCVAGFFCGKFLGFSEDSEGIDNDCLPVSTIPPSPTPVYVLYKNDQLCFDGGFTLKGHRYDVYTVDIEGVSAPLTPPPTP